MHKHFTEQFATIIIVIVSYLGATSETAATAASANILRNGITASAHAEYPVYRGINIHLFKLLSSEVIGADLDVL